MLKLGHGSTTAALALAVADDHGIGVRGGVDTDPDGARAPCPSASAGRARPAQPMSAEPPGHAQTGLGRRPRTLAGLRWRQRESARHFSAYAGPFSVDVGNGTVTHHVDVSLFPNWQGHGQVRRVTIEAGRLSIIASDRTSADGQTFHSELTWLRV
jgi:hypothetical protein